MNTRPFLHSAAVVAALAWSAGSVASTLPRTRSVTSSMDTSWSTYTPGQLSSSAREAATKPSSM